MKLLSTKGWQDYELLDSGNGKRLERFGKYIISKPDPQAIWKPHLPKADWDKADATYLDEEKKWNKNSLPDKWPLSYKNVKFYAKLTNFKHTGVFPEQVLNWDFIEEKLKNTKKEINVLNLFGYTGIASLICSANGAKVTHLDGSKPAISWARENQQLSGLADKPIRWILDDAVEFTAREARRGNMYDAIIMDPPVYGHGPNGEIWDFNKSFSVLLENCRAALNKNPLFVIINAYAISASSLMLRNMMEDYLKLPKDQIQCGELALEENDRNRMLSTGIIARF
ncbi:MAG: class I SAM-dependent methyltransferase [Candidatus Levybacteria bacterium]|nr:class I SAM-dependent methyltransferase [Candidatus Levybacteria bacterium]